LNRQILISFISLRVYECCAFLFLPFAVINAINFKLLTLSLCA
jgi:hypothetical protein